jgi:hypothetical protein
MSDVTIHFNSLPAQPPQFRQVLIGLFVRAMGIGSLGAGLVLATAYALL